MIRRYVVIIFILCLLVGCINSSYESVSVSIDLAMACGRGTNSIDRLDLSVSGGHGGEKICIDQSHVFHDIRITGLKIDHLKRYNTYVFTMFFKSYQLVEINKFISDHMHKHFYFIKNNIVIGADYYSVFSSTLSSPEISLSVDSKKDGIKLRKEIIK